MELSDDIWNYVFRNLDVRSRINVSNLNTRLNSLFSTWEDVTSLSLLEDTANLAGASFSKSTRCDLETIRKRCPYVSLVMMQTTLSENRMRQLVKFEHVAELVAPNSILSTPLGNELLSHRRLRKVRLLQRYDELKDVHRAFGAKSAIRISKLNLTVLQLSGVTIRPLSMKLLCNGLRNTLTELLLLGVLCNSANFDEYFDSIASLPKLKILELPPSLFSCCHRPIIPPKLSLLSTLNLEKLSVYIHRYEAHNMGKFISILPKNLQQLYIFTNTDFEMSLWPKELNTSFRVTRCHLSDIIVEPKWLADHRSELLTRTLWLPPYKVTQNFPRTDLPTDWYQNLLPDESDEDHFEEEQVTAKDGSFSHSASSQNNSWANVRTILSEPSSTQESLTDRSTSVRPPPSNVSLAGSPNQ